MNRLKLITSVVFATALSVMACWWTGLSYNYSYISGVNNFQEHYVESVSFEQAEYHNSVSVALPLTVYVKAHHVDSSTATITKAVLQYRVKRSESWITNWVTVRTIENPSYNLDVDAPVALFGNGTIDPKNLVSGDEIFIRYYITNGIIESGDLYDNLDNLDCAQIETYNSSEYGGGWTPPFIFKVIYNGKRRIGW